MDPRYVTDAPECPTCGLDLRRNAVGVYCDSGCDVDALAELASDDEGCAIQDRKAIEAVLAQIAADEAAAGRAS